MMRKWQAFDEKIGYRKVEDTIRVISLRKALKQERQYYEQFLQNRLGKN